MGYTNIDWSNAIKQRGLLCLCLSLFASLAMADT